MIQDKTAIRPAATVIVLRDRSHAPQVLMGQRGAQAAFMPNKFVFPGGAVDPQDAAVPLLSEISSPCKDRLSEETEGPSAQALCAAAPPPWQCWRRVNSRSFLRADKAFPVLGELSRSLMNC